MAPSFLCSRALVSTVESMTSRSSLLEPGRILTTSSLSFSVTPPPTSGTSTGFVYVDYDDYDEYSSYDDPPAPRGVVTTTTMAASTNTTLGHQVETALPRSIKSKTTTPTEPLTNVGVPSEGHTVPVKISTVPDSYTTVSVGPDDIIAATSLPNTTSSGTQPQAPINLTTIEPTATSSLPSFLTLPKKDNSVDEVSYRIVGLDGDKSKGQQSYFVPRMPPVRERTQNKRIQQLLNEKRRQGVLRRSSRTKESRTGVRL